MHLMHGQGRVSKVTNFRERYTNILVVGWEEGKNIILMLFDGGAEEFRIMLTDVLNTCTGVSQ